MKTALCAAVATAALTAPAWGTQVILNETFTDATRDTHVRGETNWWTTSYTDRPIDVSSTIGYPAESVSFTGTATNAAHGRMEISTSGLPAYNTANPEQSTITFSVDMRVDSFASSYSGYAFRFVVTDPNRVDSRFFATGFGRGNSTVGANNLFFFATENNAGNYGNAQPATSDLIGWDAQTSQWADGFNFGTHSSTASNNNTGANDDPDSGFYRLEMTFHPFNGTTQTIDIIATQLDTGNQATLTKVVTEPYNFANTGDHLIIVSGPYGSSLTGYVDNITVSVVPEPAALSLLSLGGLALLRRRRRV